MTKGSDFATLTIETKDTVSLKFIALNIYQKLTNFHLKSTLNKAALVDLELERLHYVHSHITSQKKDELYEKPWNS